MQNQALRACFFLTLCQHSSHNMIAYCIDLDTKCPEVLEYSGSVLDDDLTHFGVKRPSDLMNHPDFPRFDRRVFEHKNEANEYLERYSDALKRLKKPDICVSRDLPAMLYKRRYLVQTLLGEKQQTVRHYKKPWQPGQLFNLHDQTFFLTVRLIKIVTKRGGFVYEFEMP